MKHTTLRKMVCDTLSQLPPDEKQTISESIVGNNFVYVEEMRKDGTFADHIIVNYTSKALKQKNPNH